MTQKEEPKKGPELKDIPKPSPAEEEALSGSESSDASLKEAKQLSSGRSAAELEKDAAEREHNRVQDFRDLFDALVQIGMLIAFGGIMIMGAVWVWHLVAPVCWQWMSEQQIDHIQSLVTGGVLAVVVGDHFKRRLG